MRCASVEHAWVRSLASRSSSLPASGRARCAQCCSPISAQPYCASIASSQSELGIKRPLQYNLLLRNRKTIALDLKDPHGVETALQLIERADALIEGFRPGVTERLGLGPDVCLARNPRLVYGRMTGWGQSGPLGDDRGPRHQLHRDHGRTQRDRAHGSAADRAAESRRRLCWRRAVPGVRSARGDHRRRGNPGKGQVVDAAIVDGTASLATTFFGMHAAGMLQPQRGSNMTDSGSHFYDVYECARRRLGRGRARSKPSSMRSSCRRSVSTRQTLGPQNDPASWPQAKAADRREIPRAAAR